MTDGVHREEKSLYGQVLMNVQRLLNLTKGQLFHRLMSEYSNNIKWKEEISYV
ncbi:hypothetical protein [Bacillus sp. LL01]|uniref:hypothetical protein n=1 Tax=Bacillus sp. LL01 TaxID=1665556 RepID=UPI0018E2DE38|nr:hypothetical protein [Bacillus sp. LL01]